MNRNYKISRGRIGLVPIPILIN